MTDRESIDDRPPPAELAVEAICDLQHPVKVAATEWAAEHLTSRDRVTADRRDRGARLL